MMNKIEQLATELAFLSNTSLQQLTEILVRDYPTRVDALEQLLRIAQHESLDRIHRELGIANVE
jgi:hypothetical protein